MVEIAKREAPSALRDDKRCFCLLLAASTIELTPPCLSLLRSHTHRTLFPIQFHARLMQDEASPNHGYGSKNGNCRFKFDRGSIVISVRSNDVLEEGGCGCLLAKATQNDCTLVQSKRLDIQAQHVAVFATLKQEIITGFHLATKSGPIMEEPLFEVCVVLEDIEFVEAEEEKGDGALKDDSGKLITVVKNAMQSAFLTLPVRIIESHYEGEFQTTLTALGNLYDTLNKRRGKVNR